MALDPLLLAALLLALAATTAWSLLGALLPSAPLAGVGAGSNSSHAATRVISMMPSLTEIVAALGAGDLLVGISDYCSEPQDLCARLDHARVGGDFDANIERIYELAPDLILLGEGVRGIEPSLAAARIACLRFDTRTLESIEASYFGIGKALDREPAAMALALELRGGLRQLAMRGQARGTQPRVLVIINHMPDSLSDLWVAGRNTFLDELLSLAGAANVIEEDNYLPIGREAILAMNPDVILDLFAPGTLTPPPAEAVLALWQELPQVRAVAYGQVHYRWSNAWVAPGPRLVRAGVLEDLAAILDGAPVAERDR